MTAGRGPTAPKLFEAWAFARLPSGWTEAWLCSSLRPHSESAGEVAERLNAPVLKTGVPSRGPWVRIPPSPPVIPKTFDGIQSLGMIATRPRTIRIGRTHSLSASFSAARVPDARGFFSSGVFP